MVRSTPVHRFSRWIVASLFALTAAACSVNVAPPASTTSQVAVASSIPSAPPTVSPSSTPLPTPTAPKPSATAAPERSHWTVGLLDEPANVLPFSPDGRAAEPITQSIFPAPALVLGYAYTTTGILQELPTLTNDGVERRQVRGYLDSTGQFTTTATDQPTTTDQLVVTFHWNPRLRWADGKPVTAEDSAFGYEDARRTPPSPDAQALLDLIERYEVVDATTTRATLKPGRIDPAYPRLAWPPLPRHLLAGAATKTREQYARAPTGYGPYSFGEAKPGAGITLVRNRYWSVPGLPDELRFRFFQTAGELRAAVERAEVDVAAVERIPGDLYSTLDRDASSGRMLVRYVPGPVYEHLDFNLAEPLFQDVRVRRAAALAIDRAGLARELWGGKPHVLHSWIVPEQPEFAGEEQLQRYPYDPERARALLAQAGVVDRTGDGIREAADGKPISLTLTTADTPLAIAIGRRIARDLAAAGLPLRVQSLPITQLFSPTGPLFRRQFQLAEFAWIATVEPHGAPLWSCSAIPSQDNGFSGNNFGGWCFDPAERALRAAVNTLDPRARAAAYLRQQRVWAQELPSIPLAQRPIAILERADIRGVAPDALAPITWNVDVWKRAK